MEHEIKSIIDFGFGDGNQIKDIKIDSYIGFDISKTIVEKCRNKYKEDKKQFYLYEGELLSDEYKRELGLSLDVLYHVLEEDMYERYLKNLFNLSEKYVIIYSQNKNHNEGGHIKGREFTSYVLEKYPEWKFIKKIDQKYPKKSSADFYLYEKNPML